MASKLIFFKKKPPKLLGGWVRRFKSPAVAQFDGFGPFAAPSVPICVFVLPIVS